MFDDPETEDAEIDFEEKPRKSLIPDPEGEELRRIANLRGISAVSIENKTYWVFLFDVKFIFIFYYFLNC